ncbi:glycerol-3-phosphate 1-O-acyltransferase PlsB [Cobetia amphilecti]|uniref:glycerol-3-phosphate 1-O-acyltransferase PlsB n=1 Tax=Cobetia amphilecti TaxID=1055104 RepID=UPI00254D6703|nr:glycerol-3-phosphate 1-O-acyltransferase PlsB [Cobetia amphilecti]
MSPVTLVLRPLRNVSRRLLDKWVELRAVEPDINALDHSALNLDPTLPVVYVFPYQALSDELVVEQLCEARGLPSPTLPLSIGDLRLSHSRLRLLRRSRSDRSLLSRRLAKLIAALEDAPNDVEVQLVPVSVFWGRAPGKEFGFWKFISADSWRVTGVLRRAIAILAHGRSVDVHFGQPLRLHEALREGPQDSALAHRRISRLLRVHFRRVRTRLLGPDLSHRHTMIRNLQKAPAVQDVISELAREQNQPPARLEKRALQYGREIASNMGYPVQRFLAHALKRLWHKLYDGVEVRGMSQVKAIAGDCELIYVPCHRSHIDYLLLSYVLFHEGLMTPHVAAGKNLDMPIIGPILRRGGAFFLRRSFRGNRLYATVFDEYVHQLITRGHPLEYFIEGGRSRTGRMLPPRPGMLAMTLRSFLRDTRREVAFVPVYIGYEKVFESLSYQRELSGASKKKESPLDLIRVLGQLKQPFGKVYLNIGEPLKLGEWLDETAPDWKASRHQRRPEWLTQAVPQLGHEIATRINAAAALNPVSLTALVLLSTAHHAIEASLLQRQLAMLVRLADKLPGRHDHSLPEGTPDEWVAHCAHLGLVTLRPQSLGELVIATPEQASLLTWYRNNVLHLLALPALIAFAFRNTAQYTLEALEDQISPAWPLLVRELFVPEAPELKADIAATLALMSEEGLLEHQVATGDTPERWSRPVASQEPSEQLRLLAQPVQPTLERGYLLIAALLQHGSGTLDRESLESHSGALAERLTLLSGLNAPEFFDKRLFSGLLDTLLELEFIWLESGQLCFGEALEDLQVHGRDLFDPALRHRLQHVRLRDSENESENEKESDAPTEGMDEEQAPALDDHEAADDPVSADRKPSDTSSQRE